MILSATLDWLLARRIGLLGFGRDGQAAARALLARDPDADLSVLVERGPAETHLPVIRGPFGKRLADFDVLIRSPGVPVDHPALTAARAAGVNIVNPASIWLAERAQALTVIGVTGSKGKSTTAALLAHLLESIGRQVLLAGNIGVPLLDHLDTRAEIAVIELSSYQLADLEGHLDLGVFTRLFPEHLDWHGSERGYIAAKLRIAGLLDGRPLLVNAGDETLMAATAGVPGRVLANRPPAVWRRGRQLMFDHRALIQPQDLNLIGRHNLDNCALALEAARQLGHPVAELIPGLRSFRPLPHRLEPVATVNGIRYVNDSISTSPHSTLAALQALAPAPVVLIAGGQARPADWQPVIDHAGASGLAALLTLPDNGAAIAEHFRSSIGAQVGAIEQCDGLGAAVERAAALAGPGSVVLLSPGAPSFSRFANFEERGEHFRRAVAAL